MILSKIMLIRHAERPDPRNSIRGVTEEGVKNKEELTVRGWQRAGALVRFFAPSDNRFVHPALARPGILFACGAGPKAPSLRPQHTLLPLARLLQVEFNCDYFEGEEEKLVRAVLAAKASAALIAWKHANMSVIAHAILGAMAGVPQHWPFDRFDLVWIFDKGASNWTFTQIPQLLLAGDRPEAAT